MASSRELAPPSGTREGDEPSGPEVMAELDQRGLDPAAAKSHVGRSGQR